MPVLYIVATPIGNLEDISLRALNTLREVKLIAAEDTRTTKKLLNAYNIKTPVTSYYEHNKWTKMDYIMGYLEEGDVALVSEAGTPGISDPGHELIVAAIERGIQVVAIPGPSAIISALTVSALPANRFIYLGFLPRGVNGRRRVLEGVSNESGAIVILESPHRLIAALKDMLLVLGNRRVVVCRELTKLYEEVFRGSISQSIEHFTEPRGEVTLVIEGKREKEKPELTTNIEHKLRQMRVSGILAKEAVGKMAKETGLSKKELYRAWLKL